MANESLSACLAEIKANPDKFYVYVLSRPDGTPFYVGCASSSSARHDHRVQNHVRDALAGRRGHRSALIRKLVAQGEELLYSVESWHETAEEAFDRERICIREIGRASLGHGPLTNGNDGGTGNLLPTPNARKRSTAGWTKEKREAAAERARRQYEETDIGQRLAMAKDAISHDPDRRKARREQCRRIAADPALIAKRVASHAATMARDGGKDRIAASSKRTWQDPEIKRRRLAAIAKGQSTDEYRKLRSEISKRTLGTPEARAAASRKQSDLWACPEYRAAQSALLREARQRARTPESEQRRLAAIQRYWADRRQQK